MKEELTTKMHAEFSLDQETEIKHRAFSALSSGLPLKRAAEIYDVSENAIESYRKEFEQLKAI